VSFWAWVASISVHLIVLTAFGLVKFSESKIQAKHSPIPTAKISRIKRLTQAAPIIPKPKIRKPAREQFAKGMNPAAHVLPGARVFDSMNPGSQDLERPILSQSAYVSLNTGTLSHKIEFFGSYTEKRKVCYLVDCSGSMQGLFGRVRRKLKESIASLQPDQYFYVIFFGGGKLFESGNGRLLRATQEAKSAAYDFIDWVQPAGQTNALAAFERAVQIRDGGGDSPSVIYFLTDGFELINDDPPEAERFPQKVANLQARFAPTTKINTIGFWPQNSDREILKIIARQSGGEFVLVDN